MRRAIGFFSAAALAAGLVVLGQGTASADPSTNDWKQLRLCESSDDYSANTGNGYYGAYQFDLPTWRSVGGSGRPDQASRADQDLRALTLYRMRGWSPWICAALVGLKEDADGGSGVKPGGVTTPTPTKPTPTKPSGKPAYPGLIKPGAYNASLKAFQNRLEAMGYGTFDGTGWLGGKTIAGIKKLQKKMNRKQDGVLGSAVWAGAWNNAYSMKAPTTSVPKFPGVVKFGAYNAAYKTFQNRLETMGYGTFDGTGWYGEKTRVAVKKLQAKMGKSRNGVVTAEIWAGAWNTKYKASAAGSKPSTPSKYVPATDATCKVNSRTPLAWGGVTMVKGKTYRDLQCFQRALGSSYGLTGTGYFGASTAAAVSKLQARAHLPRTGKVDKATWNAAWTRG